MAPTGGAGEEISAARMGQIFCVRKSRRTGDRLLSEGRPTDRPTDGQSGAAGKQ